WPMIDRSRWRGEHFNLTTLLSNVFKSRLLQVFVGFGVEIDRKNTSRSLIWFSQGVVRLVPHRDYYLNREKYSKVINASKRYLIRMVQLLHKDASIPVNQKQIESDVGEIMDFESKLAKIMVADEDQRNHTKNYNLRNLSEMQALIPSVNWNHFFYSITPPAVHSYLAADPEIVIHEIDYMKRLAKLLISTDSVIVTNYVYVCYFLKWEGELGGRYAAVAKEFNKLINGRSVTPPRWDDCVQAVMRRMPEASGALYIKKVFNQETRNATLEMVNYVQEAFQDMLVENDWLDSSTKASALDKARNIRRVIGYPDFILDDKKLDDFYSGLSVLETDSYGQMTEKLARWRNDLEFLSLIMRANRSEVNFNPAIVNAFYNQISTTITITAAVLQAPLYHRTFPKALNYGSIGTVIGHEISHGFDDKGRQYDSHGLLRDWWDDEVEEEFKKRAQCLIDQYSNIKVPETGLYLNGKLTQGENIADHAGVKVAFRNYLKKFGEEKPLRVLEEYNSEQMFFIGYAAVFCERETTGRLIEQILRDEHSPSKYRVNQVLANQPEFAAAFNCPVGTPMNPTSRCAIW
ncbi:hypothetical protein Angca_010241, partial [Angiostrongylus cantonensis]